MPSTRCKRRLTLFYERLNMRSFGDLNKLITYCRNLGVSCVIDYSEASDEMALQIISAAKGEEFYVKRIIDVDWFIEEHKNHMKGEG